MKCLRILYHRQSEKVNETSRIKYEIYMKEFEAVQNRVNFLNLEICCKTSLRLRKAALM